MDYHGIAMTMLYLWYVRKKHMSWDRAGKAIWHSITIMVICPFISIYEIYLSKL